MILTFTLIDDETQKELFLRIYHQYKNLMYQIAYHILHDSGLAEDCTQEALFSIAANIRKLQQADDIRTRRYIITVVKTRRSIFTTDSIRSAPMKCSWMNSHRIELHI